MLTPNQPHTSYRPPPGPAPEVPAAAAMVNKVRTRTRTGRAFSLIELIAVIVVLGTLVLLAGFGYRWFLARSYDEAARLTLVRIAQTGVASQLLGDEEHKDDPGFVETGADLTPSTADGETVVINGTPVNFQLNGTSSSPGEVVVAVSDTSLATVATLRYGNVAGLAVRSKSGRCVYALTNTDGDTNAWVGTDTDRCSAAGALETLNIPVAYSGTGDPTQDQPTRSDSAAGTPDPTPSTDPSTDPSTAPMPAPATDPTTAPGPGTSVADATTAPQFNADDPHTYPGWPVITDLNGTCENPPPPGAIIGSGTIYGTEGDDVIYGSNNADTIYGLGGNDVICGGNGGDTIYGGAGDDVISGNNAKDTLNGDAGSDALYGANGKDTIYGGPGEDYAYGGNGKDYIG